MPFVRLSLRGQIEPAYQPISTIITTVWEKLPRNTPIWFCCLKHWTHCWETKTRCYSPMLHVFPFTSFKDWIGWTMRGCTRTNSLSWHTHEWEKKKRRIEKHPPLQMTTMNANICFTSSIASFQTFWHNCAMFSSSFPHAVAVSRLLVRSLVCSFAGSFYISNNAVIRFIYTRISWILLNTLNVLNCNISNTDKYFHQFDGLYDYIKWYHYPIKINYCNFIWLFNKIDVKHICRENNIRMHRYFWVHI